jgi:transketolase
LNEGSTWESAALAGTLQLGRLSVVLDLNGQQALGYTHDVLRVGDPAIVWSELGFEVDVVDGHDLRALTSLLSRDASPNARPKLVVARTNAGHGVSFMERRIEWHYRPMTAEQYETAIREVGTS